MSPRTSVYLLAENRLLREALSRILGNRCGISVVGAVGRSDHSLKEIAEAAADVLVLDALTSGMPGFQFVRAALEASPGMKVVLIGMEEDAQLFLQSVRAGAVGYLLKEASAIEVVSAVRAVAQAEAVCPPRLCLSLFRRVAEERAKVSVPSTHIQVRLGLTRRQQQLIPLIAQGLTNKEIATHFNLSEQTVKNHIHRMLQRVGADDRLEVVDRARVEGAAF